ncbi:tyrosine-type recombinase/integrase [Chryseobacterium sp.]|jgi:integrase|uniref:site-specific integrase n=1 Tax=Chryseobacterium sp. TaxID=1871047 RepID=UPI00283D84BC|nr:phage integrase SAM-like domain-containing protein [Chryseobacterium sp.]MDR3026616.1 site-specific integrase [Chryseobacterium sp.]
MASIKFSCIKKGNPSSLNIRFYHGRNIDCNAQSHILINPNDWSEKMQKFKPNTDIRIKNEFNPLIENLKNEIIRKFNIDYSKGDIINSKWLSKVVNDFYKRPEGIEDYKIFFAPFIENFAKESETRVNTITGKVISPRTIQKYRTIKNQIEDFEQIRKVRLKITDINLDFHRQFTSYLKTDKKYSNTLIEKNISTIKGFVKEAKEQGLEINHEVESKKFTFRRDEPIDTYLSVSEIDLIYNLDFSQNERLDNVRDLFIIGVWTGLRISDLKRINSFLFNKNSIVISETQKTGAIIEIPIHQQVRKILTKRNNQLPHIISEQKFNEYIKEVCKEAGIDEMTLGNIKNPDTNRKEKGYYPKFKLISSHTARRSFATNHYGNLPDNTIMAITGHKSHSQFMKYIKTTQKEHIEQVAKYWEQQDELKNEKHILKKI